jgi:hypothetical protein
MDVQEIDLSIERKIVIYMITSTPFLRNVSVAVRPEYFESLYAKTVAQWIMEYWGEFKQSPGKYIQDIFNRKLRQISDEDLVDVISDFLLDISKEYQKGSGLSNVDYFVTEATEYFRRRSLELIRDSLDVALVQNDITKGESLIASYNRVSTIRNSGTDLLTDTSSIIKAFYEDDEQLFSFPGALGKVVGPFVRGDLVSYLAAAKRGKSWWELYTGICALVRGFRVVHFNLEMKDSQIKRRVWQALVGMPRKPQKIMVPKFELKKFDHTRTKNYYVEKHEEDRTSVKLDVIEEQQKEFRKHFRGGNYRIITFPPNTVSCSDLYAHLDNLEHYDSYVPDIVIVDYADLLIPSKGKKYNEYRHQLDDIWKDLRALAAEKDCMVVTASQSGRKSFKKDAGEDDIAEDIRKIAHVSKMISINRNREDRDFQAVRIQQLAERDFGNVLDTVTVLQCLDVGKVCLDSRYTRNVFYDDYEE